MQINNSNPITQTQQMQKSMNNQAKVKNEDKQQVMKKENTIADKAAIYIKGDTEIKAKPTYDIKLSAEHLKTIERLKQESEKAYENLRQIVIDLMERQGHSVEKLKSGTIEVLEVDESARAEAAALIADDGPLGAEAVSERIVQFAMAISGGNPSKKEQLLGAIEAGFAEVEKIFGELPEVSRKTYDLIIEKMDKWE